MGRERTENDTIIVLGPLSSDGCVVALVQGGRGAGRESRAVLLGGRVLAPRLLLRVVPCHPEDSGDCKGCSLDPGAGNRIKGTAILRPSAALVLGRRTCYRLVIINITPISTRVNWEPPMGGDSDILKVTFTPNSFEIGSYGQVEINVVLDALKVCERRIFVLRATVAHAYKPLYLVIDAAVAYFNLREIKSDFMYRVSSAQNVPCLHHGKIWAGAGDGVCSRQGRDVLVDKKELENQLEYRELIEEQYYSNIAAAKCLIEVDKNTNSNCSQSIISKPVAVKLPEIKLMCFDGSYDLWRTVTSCHGNPIQCNLSQAIDTQLKRFWELEEVTITNKLLTEDEHTCEHLFDTTTKRNADGRFLVRIPLQQSADHLGDSYALAESRFLSLERKLERLPFYKKLYYDFIHEYVELGHMTKVDEYNKPYYFLPHHGVLREHSTTTKLRVVFDASAVTTSNKSLNDIQYVGPPLQNDIFSILLRFRQYKFVASADVEKMFRQILIQMDQRNLQLIVWRENPSDPLSIYRLNTVTYGTASAPYLSMRCLKQLAIECGDDMIAKIINEDFYVDDLITGHDDKQILLEICNKVSQVLSSGCFTLRKWTFSHDVKTSSSKELCTGDHCQNKTLGIGWYNTSDELHFTTAITESHVVTKRTILSILSQIYDPLGLLTPVIIIAKILLQHLWLCKIHWDDTVPENIKLNWEKFINSLKSLHELRIPRYIMSDNNEIKELHIFTDASQNAYGACAYIRTYNKNIDSPVTIKLLCAKSKVSPIKPVTIPRLELCGALLGARLYKKIVSSLRLKFDKVYFWTDSTIVMGWVRMSPHLLKTFVQHRVTEINELTGDAIWLHVNGKNNPADLASRGAYLDILVDCTLWWDGPTFLHGRQFNCKVDHSTYTSIELPEVKNEIVCAASNIKDSFINFSRFSSFERLKRTGAYVLRFITNIRSPKHLRTTGSLSVDELSASITMLARLEQIQSFPDEYDSLLKQLPLNQTKSNKVSGLNIFLDQSGLIRVGGRLRNSRHFDYNKKYPILISDPNDFLPLTPSHFLIGRPLTALPCKDLTSTATHRLMRYDRIEQMRQHFWQRWSKEYVSELQTRTKWKVQQPDIGQDTLVLIKEDNLPPLKWRMGRILRTFPGKDGVSRVAEIRTATGIIQRATSKICPLPPQPSDAE
ncbi:uncharacterized protein LOC113516532 [Galleria mellonella]|uniref:Uncharacterized protein LOC113516532 n=1 Tax=Galleria mellonella TaxID=7137 RepID=A0ABM3M905_GALME|nr:uncharacterized protein LOC113516532 [Galleria mellonella]